MVNLPPYTSTVKNTQGYYGKKSSSSKKDEPRDEFVVADTSKSTSQTGKQENHGASKKILELCGQNAEIQNADDKIRRLIEQGGDPNSKDIHGNTPLIYSLSNRKFNIVNTLLELGANPNLAGNLGSFPLECASKLRIPSPQVEEQLRTLLDFGADPNQRDDKGFTTLMYAVRDNKKSIVQFLLDNGAKISIKNKAGLTAIDLAKQWKNVELAKLLEDTLQARTNKSPEQFIIECYRKGKLISEYDGDFSLLLDSDVVEYVALRLREDFEKNKDNANKVKVRLHAQYENSEPLLQGFWERVSDKAFGKTIARLIDNETKGFDRIFGMDSLKQELQKSLFVAYDFQINPHKYNRPGLKKLTVKKPGHVLLYGLPGTGKTAFAKAMAEELGRKPLEVSMGTLASTYRTGVVQNMHKIFDAAKQEPSAIILNEFEAVAGKRENLSSEQNSKQEEVDQLLQELDDARENNILVIATTNFRDKIDDAIARLGRFSHKYEISPPNMQARANLFKSMLKVSFEDTEFSDEDIQAFAKHTRGYTPAAIQEVCDIVATTIGNLRQQGIEADPDALHVENAIKAVKPELTTETLAPYNID